jgi:cyanophycinase
VKRFGPALGLALLVVGAAASSQEGGSKTPEIGPARGTLFIIGGGLKEKALLERFLDLAGGPDAPVVVIPTALESDDPAVFATEVRALREAGGRHLTVAHTRDRKVADSEAFVAPIREASGVYFTGGRQWRLADSYLNTRTHRELRALLDRGGVIGGTSAGATIQGSFLARGDTRGNTVMIGDHVEGMGFLKNVTIDQHLLKRNRQFDLVEVVEKHPELLGIGIDEDTAIIVRGDRFEVIGNGYVAIYDHNRRLDSGGLFYLLAPGDRYDLRTREAERPESRGAPVERVVKEPWKE